MNPLDNLKRIKAFAKHLKNKKELTAKQYQYLADVFERIGNGEDPSDVLGIKFKRGSSAKDAQARQKISLALHWVANAILSEAEGGLGYTLERAFEEVENHFPDFSYELLKKYWYQPDKSHMKNQERTPFDPDSPFNV